MNNLWFSSDLHLDHVNILNFVNYDGDKVRPEFNNVEEMNETIIERHNNLVRPNDKYYCLGDVIFGFNQHKAESILSRLNGKKRLILGNHDNYFPIEFYAKFFDKITSEWRPTGEVIFTHRAIFIDSTEPKLKKNVHGHVHRTRKEQSPKHVNISVEMTDYAPIHWEDVMKRCKLKNYDIKESKI